MDQAAIDSHVQRFIDAEQRYLEHCGVQGEFRNLTLKNPAISARVFTGGTGSPVLFMHGGGSIASSWALLWGRLSEYRLIAPDRPGCGLIEFVDYRNVDMKKHAADFIASVLDAVAVDKVDIVANSMGALWSLWFTQAHPARVSRLAMLGVPALILDSSAPVVMRLLSVPVLNRLIMKLDKPSEKQVQTLYQRLGHDAGQCCTPELTELTLQAERLPRFADGFLGLLQNVLQLRGARLGLNFDAGALQGIEHEVLYVWGSNDPFGSVDVGRRACAATPHGVLKLVGQGHLPWLDEPEACAVAVREFFSGRQRQNVA